MQRRATAMILLTLAVVAAGLLYFAHIARSGLIDDLSRWADQQRLRGWVVEGRVAPPVSAVFAPEIGLRDARIVGGDDVLPGGFELAADSVDMRVDFLHPRILHVTVGGNVTLRLASYPQVTFAADRLVGTVVLRTGVMGQGGKIASISIDGKNLHSTDLGGMSVGIINATVNMDDQGAKLAITTEALTVPVDPYGLGQHISDFTLNAALDGWPPGEGSRGARADVWRASGGKIEISNVVVGWGPLGVAGQGELTLDQALQPDGSARFQVRGYQTVLDSLGSNGALIAELIAAAQPGDAAEFDVRLKKSAVNVDRIRLIKIPHIQW